MWHPRIRCVGSARNPGDWGASLPLKFDLPPRSRPQTHRSCPRHLTAQPPANLSWRGCSRSAAMADQGADIYAGNRAWWARQIGLTRPEEHRVSSGDELVLVGARGIGSTEPTSSPRVTDRRTTPRRLVTTQGRRARTARRRRRGSRSAGRGADPRLGRRADPPGGSPGTSPPPRAAA